MNTYIVQYKDFRGLYRTREIQASDYTHAIDTVKRENHVKSILGCCWSNIFYARLINPSVVE